jgi:hypothetical protein
MVLFVFTPSTNAVSVLGLLGVLADLTMPEKRKSDKEFSHFFDSRTRNRSSEY